MEVEQILGHARDAVKPHFGHVHHVAPHSKDKCKESPCDHSKAVHVCSVVLELHYVVIG